MNDIVESTPGTQALDSRKAEIIRIRNDRQRLILFELLTADKPITLAELAAITYVSKITITRDLNLLENILAPMQVFLQRKPNFGTIAVGREDDIRHAIISLIFDLDIEADLLDLAIWGKRKPSGFNQPPLKTHIIDKLASWRISECWCFAAQICEGLSCSLPESDQLVLTLYCTLMLHRFQNGHLMNLPENIINKQKTTHEFAAIQKVADKFLSIHGIHLTDAELTQLTLEVCTLSLSPRDTQISSRTTTSDEYTHFAYLLLSGVSKLISVDLYLPEVHTRLAEHLSRSIVRIRHGLPISNPLQQQVQNNYPLLWSATTQVLDELSTSIGNTVPAEEIAYIVMYLQMALQLSNENADKPKRRVVVVCPHAGITAWMLLTRLQTEVPELEVVDVIPIRKLSQVDANSIDAVITSTDINSRKLMVITVSPLVGKEDIEKIRKELNM